MRRHRLGIFERATRLKIRRDAGCVRIPMMSAGHSD
jgi:hypothetical protein